MHDRIAKDWLEQLVAIRRHRQLRAERRLQADMERLRDCEVVRDEAGTAAARQRNRVHASRAALTTNRRFAISERTFGLEHLQRQRAALEKARDVLQELDGKCRRADRRRCQSAVALQRATARLEHALDQRRCGVREKLNRRTKQQEEQALENWIVAHSGVAS